jgi:ferrochelatase
MRFQPEPKHSHGSAARTGVLLLNLGTPQAPEPGPVRRYLAQFLSDARVVEIPRWLWLPILHGVVLRVRPARSAAKYAAIWTDQGSPLQVWTEKQAKLLHGYLGERGLPLLVRHAMRYGRGFPAGRAEGRRLRAHSRRAPVPAVFGHHHGQRV